MLVLSRKLHEVIHIGNDISIQVVRITPDQVRLGVTAPRAVPVLRRELIDRDRKEEDADSAAG